MVVNAESTQERRVALLEAAAGVFLRYGFKKTSMDDLARAAGISRQGLYLHFATKEAMFREVVAYVVRDARERARAALASEGQGAEQRVLGAFEAMLGDRPESEHMSELLETASALVGAQLEELELGFVDDLSRVLKSSGIAASWDKAGVSAKALAEHLQATSYGLKCRQLPRAEYLERMRIAVRIVCRGGRR